MYSFLVYSVPVPDIGVYQEDVEKPSCNTEKDRVKLNDRTAGIKEILALRCVLLH